MGLTQKIVVAAFARDLLRETALDSIEAVYAARGEVVTRSGTTEVVRVIAKGVPDGPVLFIKKYWVRGIRDLRRTWLRGAFFGRSKVKSEYENLEFLRAAGLGAPRPLAFGEERRSRALLRSFLITEGIRNPRTLTDFVREELSGAGDAGKRARRRRLVENLADYTRRLHEQRFVHHDYFWRNILLSGDSIADFWLIDAPKGRRWRWGEQRHRAKDLGTLDSVAPLFFRRTERLRFFLRYAGISRLTPAHKRLVRRALAVARPLREAQRRRVGPLPAHAKALD